MGRAGRRWLKLCLVVGTLASASAGALAGPSDPVIPQRIISLDYCADQYVLRFVERPRILAVSPDATRDFSYERAKAVGVPVVSPRAEDVVLREPDLVVRSYGGGPGVTALLERAGIAVVNLGFSNSIEDILTTIARIAPRLGNAREGQTLVTQMRARLARLKATAAQRSALYLTPTGVTSGPGSLVHEMLRAAGLVNYSERAGWHLLPLEQLAYRQPDLVAAAFFNTQTSHRDAWSPSRHPVAQRQLQEQPVVPLQGAWTACGGWFLMEAIEALAASAHGP